MKEKLAKLMKDKLHDMLKNGEIKELKHLVVYLSHNHKKKAEELGEEIKKHLVDIENVEMRINADHKEDKLIDILEKLKKDVEKSIKDGDNSEETKGINKLLKDIEQLEVVVK